MTKKKVEFMLISSQFRVFPSLTIRRWTNHKEILTMKKSILLNEMLASNYGHEANLFVIVTDLISSFQSLSVILFSWKCFGMIFDFSIIKSINLSIEEILIYKKMTTQFNFFK